MLFSTHVFQLFFLAYPRPLWLSTDLEGNMGWVRHAQVPCHLPLTVKWCASRQACTKFLKWIHPNFWCLFSGFCTDYLGNPLFSKCLPSLSGQTVWTLFGIHWVPENLSLASWFLATEPNGCRINTSHIICVYTHDFDLKCFLDVLTSACWRLLRIWFSVLAAVIWGLNWTSAFFLL